MLVVSTSFFRIKVVFEAWVEGYPDAWEDPKRRST